MLGRTPLQRRSSTVHRGDLVLDWVGATTQRVVAALSVRRSCAGRARNAMVRPDSAASCNRREPAMSSPLPSAMTASTEGQRNATSTAQKRVRGSGGSTQMLRAMTSPKSVGFGQHARPIQTIGRFGSPSDAAASARRSERAACARAANGGDGYSAADPGAGSGSNHSCTPPNRRASAVASPRAWLCQPRSTPRESRSGPSRRSMAEMALAKAWMRAESAPRVLSNGIRSEPELIRRVYIRTDADQEQSCALGGVGM